MALLAALWFVVLVDPQWFLANRGITALLALPIVMFLIFGAALGFTALTSPAVAKRWIWYPPLLIYAAIVSASVPFAVNSSVAFVGTKTELLYWTMIVGTAVLLDTPKRAEFLIIAYAMQYFWWALWGTAIGLVFWHPSLSNYDTYGSMMVIGGGLCAFLVIAAEDKRLKRILALTVALAVIGVVASFARGAFLTALCVAGVVWARSPHKGRSLAAGIGCAIIFAGAATVLFGDVYWQEMATILDGTEEATGEDRWAMWQAAFGVFLQHPFIGVGFDNWGIFASTYYQPGELEGVYGANPLRLYGISAHSSYVTVLAEHGLFGVMAFGAILVDFWRRNAYLRTEAAARRWRELGGRLDLRNLALGLEAAMVGWMGGAALYTMQGIHWHYTLLALNLMVHTVVTRPAAGGGGRRAAAARRGRPGVRQPPRRAAVGAPLGFGSSPAPPR